MINVISVIRQQLLQRQNMRRV